MNSLYVLRTSRRGLTSRPSSPALASTTSRPARPDPPAPALRPLSPLASALRPPSSPAPPLRPSAPASALRPPSAPALDASVGSERGAFVWLEVFLAVRALSGIDVCGQSVPTALPSEPRLPVAAERVRRVDTGVRVRAD